MKSLKKAAIPVLCVLCAAALVFLLVALFRPAQEKAVFVPPAFDTAATAGTPDVPESLGYSLLSRDDMAYAVGLCGRIVANGDMADVYFTNPAGNSVWLKLRLYDPSGTVLAETGLLRPGEYRQSVLLNRPVESGEAVVLKVMSYEPDTYHSMGSVTLNTKIEIGG